MTVAPSSAASSGERWGSGSVWPQVVELPYCLLGILQIGWRLPGGCVIPLLLDQVLESVVKVPAVQDTLDLPLLLSIHDDWWRWGRYLSREGVA